MKIGENTDFLAQAGEVDKLKKEREKKTKVASKDLTGEKKETDENTPVLQGNFIDIQLAKYDLAEATVEQWKKDFLTLKITDVENKEQMLAVVDAHRLVKNTRVNVEKKRKELKEDSLSFGRKVDAEARRLTELITPIEEYLESQKNIVELAKEKVRLEKETMMRTRMQERTTILLSFGCVFDGENFTLQEGEEKLTINALDTKMSDDQQFNIFQLKAEILYEKSKIRIAAEQAAAVAERERVETIAAQQKEEADRLAKQAADLKAAQDALDKQKGDMEIAEEKRLAVAKAEADAKLKAEADKVLALKVAEEEKEKALQAAETKRLADIAAIEKAAQDKILADKKAADDKLAEEAAAKLKAEKEAALRPDRLKLEEFALFVEMIKLPDVSSAEALPVVATIKESLIKLAAWTRTQTNKLQ